MSAQSCPTCDAQLPENARFCSNCGQTIAQTNETMSLTRPWVQGSPATAPSPAPISAPGSGQPLSSQQPYPAQPAQGAPAYVPQYSYPQQPAQPQQINVTVNTSAQAVSQAGTNVVLVKQKSLFVAFLLTFLFGPFGIFYVSVAGAIIWILVSIVLSLLTAGGFGLVAWIVSMIWGVVAASNYNKRIVVR
jgi:hypothetical protein